MALSTRTKLAGLGVALAAGVLGVTGYAYAGQDGGAEAGGTSYVTVVEDAATDPAAPAAQDGRAWDCPEDGSGGPDGSESPAPSTPSSPPAVDEGDL
jgi:hypothetical protein